jgi:hypothetical protein
MRRDFHAHYQQRATASKNFALARPGHVLQQQSENNMSNKPRASGIEPDANAGFAAALLLNFLNLVLAEDWSDSAQGREVVLRGLQFFGDNPALAEAGRALLNEVMIKATRSRAAA